MSENTDTRTEAASDQRLDAVTAHPSLPRLSQPGQKRDAERLGLTRVIASAKRLHEIHESWGRAAVTPDWRQCYQCQVYAVSALAAADAVEQPAIPSALTAEQREDLAYEAGYESGRADAVEQPKLDEEHAAYADPIRGGWDGYQAACWDCDWRSPTVHPRGSDGKGAAQEEAWAHADSFRLVDVVEDSTTPASTETGNEQ